MRPHQIVMAAVFFATCLSGGCNRSSSDGSPTVPSSISFEPAFTAPRPVIPVSPAPPGLPGPSGLPGFVSCDHTKAQFAIGQPASNDLLERARNDAGARIARFLRPNDVITMEFLAWRLNVLLDARNFVRSMYCG
jgi:hypothetical protein